MGTDTPPGDDLRPTPTAPRDEPAVRPAPSASAPPESSASPDDPPRPTASGSLLRLGDVAALVTALTGLGGLLLGFLGLPTLVNSPTAARITETVRATATVTMTATPSGSAVAGEPGPSPQPSSTPSAAPRGTSYKFDVPMFYGLNFSADPPVVDKEKVELYYGGQPSIMAMNGRFVVLRPEEEGTLQTCRTVTRYTGELKNSSLTKGTRFCHTTDQGTIALVTILEMPARTGSTSNFFSLETKVWRAGS